MKGGEGMTGNKIGLATAIINLLTAVIVFCKACM